MYARLKYWYDNYGICSTDDKRAVENFVECETREIVSSLRSELIQVANGNFNPESLDVLIGKQRSTKHGTYIDWAKLMLQWMAISERR